MSIYIEPDDIPDEIVLAATDWQMEFRDAEPTPALERWAQLQAWLNADPRHSLAYKQVQRIASHLAGLGVRHKPLQRGS
jgi:ferric-dicitrate binding protein FerR (iron transport regulator)